MDNLNLAFIVATTEYERGWGSKPDGIICFASEKHADEFIAEEHANRTDTVPDCYNTYEKIGYKEVLSNVLPQIAEATELKGKKYVWYWHASDCLPKKK